MAAPESPGECYAECTAPLCTALSTLQPHRRKKQPYHIHLHHLHASPCPPPTTRHTPRHTPSGPRIYVEQSNDGTARPGILQPVATLPALAAAPLPRPQVQSLSILHNGPPVPTIAHHRPPPRHHIWALTTHHTHVPPSPLGNHPRALGLDVDPARFTFGPVLFRLEQG